MEKSYKDGANERQLMLEWDFKCLFVCLWFYVLLQNFSLVWRRHHYRWTATNFDLHSALMVIEKWGFFNVPPTLIPYLW